MQKKYFYHNGGHIAITPRQRLCTETADGVHFVWAGTLLSCTLKKGPIIRMTLTAIDENFVSGPRSCTKTGKWILPQLHLHFTLNSKYFNFPEGGQFTRHLVVGGDEGNTRLWIGDRDAENWRPSVKLPYENSSTSYNAALFAKNNRHFLKSINICNQYHLKMNFINRVYLTGGFTEPDANKAVTNAKRFGIG